MPTLTRRAAVAVSTVALAASGLTALSTGAADAAGRDGVCDGSELCYYFNSNQAGSLSDFTGDIDDYGAGQPTCYDFKSAGNGKGLCVKNHAASVWNRSAKTVRVYFNSGFKGASQDVAPGAKVNLNATLKNNNASHQLVSGDPGPGPCKTDGSQTKLPSSILVYRTDQGRVERVDFRTYVKNVLPNEWISSWPAESLKAGAVAVKSYAWYWALHSTRKTPSGQCYDVRDDTGDQVYKPGTATTPTNAAVDATWATRLARGGKVLSAHYCATRTACGAWVDGDWMSQNGSRDLAGKGWDVSRILHNYYRDVSVAG